MTHYFDSSGVVKIYLEEIGSDLVETICLQNSEGEIGISQIAGAEVHLVWLNQFLLALITS
jgi:hypothetical protein